MDILDDMGVSKLSAKVFGKVNYSFNICILYSTGYYTTFFGLFSREHLLGTRGTLILQAVVITFLLS